MNIKLKGKLNKNLIIGLIMLSIVIIILLVGIVYTPYMPDAMNGREKNMPPSLSHIFGTDNFGRDIFSRIMEGIKVTFLVAISTVFIGVFFGIIIGALTGYFGGIIDEVVMRINDGIIAFPSILLALVIICVLGTGKYNIVLALGITFIPSFVRVVRSEVKTLKERDFVRSAKVQGAGNLRIIFFHIMPNTMPIILSSIVIGFNNAVLAEASMSYLGLGIQPPNASLGRMLFESQTYLFSSPWYALSVGTVIVFMILSFNIIHDGIK